MEAALITGMFNFGVSATNTQSKDVFNKTDTKFEDYFSKNLQKEKGIQNEKENTNKVKDNEKKDVDDKDEVNKIEDNKEEISKTEEKKDVKDKDKIKNKKDEQDEVTEKINGFVENILKEVEILEVDNINLEDVKKIIDGELLTEVENLGLTNEEMLKLQEVLKEKLVQNVVEVGPQSVETEKITFNKYDDLESKLEALEESLGKKDSKMNNEDVEIIELNPELNVEELSSNLVSSEEESGLENKDGKSKENKINAQDFVKKGNVDNKIEQLDVEIGKIDEKILDVKTENISDVVASKATNMQEQIDVIKQIAEKVDVNLFEDKSEMIIKLKPDHLGKVTVEIAVENGNITAKFLAESEKVKEILESNMQDLKDHLAKQGMVVQDLSVSVGNEGKGHFYEGYNYNSLKKRQKIEEVNDEEAYFIDDEFGINELKAAYYWPDSTVSFSA